MIQLYSESEDIQKKEEKRYQAAKLKIKRKVASIEFLIKESKCSGKNKDHLTIYFKNLASTI